jgi:hypothetical protein
MLTNPNSPSTNSQTPSTFRSIRKRVLYFIAESYRPASAIQLASMQLGPQTNRCSILKFQICDI